MTHKVCFSFGPVRANVCVCDDIMSGLSAIVLLGKFVVSTDIKTAPSGDVCVFVCVPVMSVCSSV